MSVAKIREYRCDAPSCDATAHETRRHRAGASDREMRDIGWAVLRWRFRLSSGRGAVLALCPLHVDWRPSRGKASR